MVPTTLKKVTVPAIRAMKGKERIGMLTAYDFPSAKVVDSAGTDIILVGDSLGMVVLGYPDTLSVTVDDMIHHTRAVARGVAHALVVGDAQPRQDRLAVGPRQNAALMKWIEQDPLVARDEVARQIDPVDLHVSAAADDDIEHRERDRNPQPRFDHVAQERIFGVVIFLRVPAEAEVLGETRKDEIRFRDRQVAERRLRAGGEPLAAPLP